jgi:cell division protein FtsN
MSSDYKHIATPSSRRSGARQAPCWLWGLAGLMAGLTVALVVYVHQTGRPLASLAAKIEPPVRLSNKPYPQATSAQASTDVAAANQMQAKAEPPARSTDRGADRAGAAIAHSQPSYDFYKVLPDMQVTVGPEVEQVKPKPTFQSPLARMPEARPEGRQDAQKPDQRKPVERIAERPLPKPQAGAHYFVQAGSFSQREPAERLKAQLAMLGLESSIQRIDAGQNEARYRVRIGPFRDLAQVDQVRGQLRQHQIDAIVLRAAMLSR